MQKRTAFAEFIFDLVKVNEHFAKSALASAGADNECKANDHQSLMQSIVFYKDATGTLTEGFLDLSNAIKAPSLLDLFFPEDFIIALFSNRNYVKKAFNPLVSSNPPIGFHVIYDNMKLFFSNLNAPDFLTFLEQCASQMRGKKGVLQAIPKNRREAFFDFVIAKFHSEFAADSAFALLPRQTVNKFMEEARSTGAIQTPDDKDISEVAVCKMLACLLLLQLSRGKSGEGDSQQLFEMLWDFHDSVIPVWEGAEQLLPDEGGNALFGDSVFCPALFEGLVDKQKEPHTLVEELSLASSLIVVGDGGSGKTFFAKKLFGILKNNFQGNIIECAGNKKIKIVPGAAFGTAIYFKLHEFQEEISFCKKIYEYRNAFFPKFSSGGEDTPLFTSESQRNWLAHFINEIYKKQIVIILDGFNEISYRHRKTLIAEIESLNKEIRKESLRPCFVITSRPGYEKDFSKLSAKQVFLLRLSSDSISDYLNSYGNLHTYRRNLGRQRQEKLDRLLSSPLLLELFVRTYKKCSPNQIPKDLNRCLIFDDACKRFIDNLDETLKPYGEFCYRLLLPDMLAGAKYGKFSFATDKTSFFIQNWIQHLEENKNDRFCSEFDLRKIAYDEYCNQKGYFREVLRLLLGYLSPGQDYMHEMVFDFFRAKAVLNECLYDNANYSGLLFTQSQLHNLISLSFGSNVDTALENLQTALMLAEMGEEKVSDDSSAEPEALYKHFSTEYKTHWPEFLFAVVNFIDTLREDSTLLLKYFFMLEPITEDTNGNQNYMLQRIDRYLQDAYADDSVLYYTGVFYNSTAFILNRLLDKKELADTFSEELKALDFYDITAFKNAVVPSFLDTAQVCAEAYSKKIDGISSDRHRTDMAHLLEAKIQNNYGAYYLRRYQNESNPEQKEVFGKQLDKYRSKSLSIKDGCEQKYLQSFGKSPDCAFPGKDCAKCEKYKDGNHGFEENHPECKDYRTILTSLNDSYTAMGTDHFYKAEYYRKSENPKNALCEYETAIKLHQKGEEHYKRANGENAVALVNRLRLVGCEIRQQLLLNFTDLKKDKALQANQGIFDIINAIRELLNNEQIKCGVEREALKNNIFALSPFIFEDKKINVAYIELLSAYEDLYEEFFSGRENPLPLKNEIILSAYSSLLQEAEDLIRKGKFTDAFKKYDQIINNLNSVMQMTIVSGTNNAFLFSIRQKIFHCQTRQVALWKKIYTLNNADEEKFNVASPVVSGPENFVTAFKNRNSLSYEDAQYVENDFWTFSSELYYLVNNNISDSKSNSFIPHFNSWEKLYRTYFEDTGTHFEKLLEELLKEEKYQTKF